MPRKAPSIPGFTGVSDQVFVREGDPTATGGKPEDPDVVVIYGWGDGLPQHVAKYATGFQALYPRAKQIVVLSPIAKAMFTDRAQRRGHMTPVVDSIFGSPATLEGAKNASGSEEESAAGAAAAQEAATPPKILLHCMSNTGAINTSATLDAYRVRFARAMPHTLLVMDSTPGGTDMTRSNLRRWSRAMALGTAGWFPWPFVVTQSIWGFFLFLNQCFLWLRRRKHAGAWGRIAVNTENYAVKTARRLYMYSKEDDLIGYEDIVTHAAEATQKGYPSDTKMFVGSGHVGHMRLHPEEYWAAIRESWERTSSHASV